MLIIPPGLISLPVGVVAGFIITKSGKYRPQLWAGWSFLLIAAGLYTTLDENTSSARAVGFEVIHALGLGIIVSCAVFPVLAPIPATLNPQALALFTFVRFFAQVRNTVRLVFLN